MKSSSLPPVIFLMGPTASGKTDLAIELCQHLPCEIISVDSALIYRGMDIGTAKPSPSELALAPHRLINIRDPSEAYSAAEFRADALSAIEDIVAAGKIPLLVGGTMLYFKTLLEGIADMPATDLDIRAQIELDASQYGWPYVHEQLAAVDPESAARIHPNHSQRIERALAVYRSSGITMTAYRQLQIDAEEAGGGVSKSFPYQAIQMAIAPLDRAVLHRRIANRFALMMEGGLIEEVEKLVRRGDLSEDLPSIRAVGYRQVWQYLAGVLSRDEMIGRGVIATRQLAKRQFTWLRSWDDLQWIYTDEKGLLVASEADNCVENNLIGQPPIKLALKFLQSLVI